MKCNQVLARLSTEATVVVGLKDYLFTLAGEGISADEKDTSNLLHGFVKHKRKSPEVHIYLDIKYEQQSRRCMELLPIESERLLRCIGQQKFFTARIEQIERGPKQEEWFLLSVSAAEAPKFEYLKMDTQIDMGEVADFSVVSDSWSNFVSLMQVDMTGGCTDWNVQQKFCMMTRDFLQAAMLPLPLMYYMYMTFYSNLTGLHEALSGQTDAYVQKSVVEIGKALDVLSNRLFYMLDDGFAVAQLEACERTFFVDNAKLMHSGLFKHSFIKAFGKPLDGDDLDALLDLALSRIELLAGSNYNPLDSVEKRSAYLLHTVIGPEQIEQLLCWGFVFRWLVCQMESGKHKVLADERGSGRKLMTMYDLNEYVSGILFDVDRVKLVITEMISANLFALQKQSNHGKIVSVFYFLRHELHCNFVTNDDEIVSWLRTLKIGTFKISRRTFCACMEGLVDFFQKGKLEVQPNYFFEVVAMFVTMYKEKR